MKKRREPRLRPAVPRPLELRAKEEVELACIDCPVGQQETLETDIQEANGRKCVKEEAMISCIACH